MLTSPTKRVSPSRPSSWALAGIEANAFVDTPEVREQWPLLRRGCVRTAMWLVLLASERRVNEAGTALCLFAPRSLRSWLGALARLAALALLSFLLLITLAVVWRPLAVGSLVTVLVLVTPCAWSGWRNRRAKSLLASFVTGPSAIYVHSVARTPGQEAKGAGATVMESLAQEADDLDWRLALDAGCPSLVRYYQRFGFEPVGSPLEMTWGTAVRMLREPVSRYG
jgi:hypothetical protein